MCKCYSSLDDSSSEVASNDRFWGNGHTKSLQSGGQNSRILSSRYHCHVNESPSGTTTSGRDYLCGFQDISFTNLIFHSVESSLQFLTKTHPGESVVNLKWDNFFMPLSAFLMVLSLINSIQSYDGTITHCLVDLQPAERSSLLRTSVQLRQCHPGNQLWCIWIYV